MIDDAEDDILEIEPVIDDGGDPYSPTRLLGVAFAGALASLGAYYLYHQLDNEKKDRLKDKASTLVARQIQSFMEVDED